MTFYLVFKIPLVCFTGIFISLNREVMSVL